MFRHAKGIEVFIWNRHVGTIIAAGAGRYPFAYDREFLRSGIEIAPLEMALSERIYEFPGLPPQLFWGLPPAIADSLPDSFGNALIDRWMAERGVAKAEITALDRLSYTGTRGPGALTFQPGHGPKYTRDSAVEMRKLVEQARLAANAQLSELDAKEQLNEIIRLGSSLGGAQAKAVVGWNRERGDFRYGTLDLPPEYEQWLLKFTPPEHPARGELEYAMYLKARECGIEMMESRLYELDGIKHFMTRRFDREDGKRHHVLTFSAMCHVFGGGKGNAAAAYEQLFMAIERLGMDYAAKEQMFRRMVFNVAADECDDHVKNFAFRLKEGGRWELAPAYDLTGTPSERVDGVWGSYPKVHALSVNGKQSGIGVEDMLRVADRFGIGRAREIVDEIQAKLGRVFSG